MTGESIGAIAPNVEVSRTERGWMYHGSMPPERLRYYMTYWDRLIVIDTDINSHRPTPDQTLLGEAGLLEHHRVHIDMPSAYTSSDAIDAHCWAVAARASDLAKRYSGRWAAFVNDENTPSEMELFSELAVADVELSNCLPVPRGDVPIEGLLDFKNQRDDELTALRGSLDDLYLSIASSSDIPRAKNRQIDKLEHALGDLDRVVREKWHERVLNSMSVRLDAGPGSLAVGATVSAVTGSSVGDPFVGVIAGIVSTGAASLRIQADVRRSYDQLKDQQIDLSYIASLKSGDIV